ncbi:MAG TPA: hypothetical protein VGN57_11960 [Pirellulaceae bacterium]|nr:hypothetical protein [Pirellulaceae bacterium]
MILAAVASYFAGPPFGWGLAVKPLGWVAWTAVQVTTLVGSRIVIRWMMLGPSFSRLRIVAGPAIALGVWSVGWYTMGRSFPYGAWLLLAVVDAGTFLALWGLLALIGERDAPEDTVPPRLRFGIVDGLLALATLCVLAAFGRLMAPDSRILEDSGYLWSFVVGLALTGATFFTLDASLRLAILGDTLKRRYLGAGLGAFFAVALVASAFDLIPGIRNNIVGLAGYFLLVAGYDALLRSLGIRAMNARRSSSTEPL